MKQTKALKLYNLTMKVSREKLLKQQLDLMVKDSTLDIQDKLENKLVEAVDREVERQAHILGEHVKIDDNEVKAVVNSNFKGVNWSTRLWQDMALVQKKWKQRRAMYYLEGDILMSMYLSLKSKQIPLLIMLVDY